MDSGALSPTTTTTPTTTEASAAVDAVINLDTKTKETTTTMMQQQQQQQQQTQKLRKCALKQNSYNYEKNTDNNNHNKNSKHSKINSNFCPGNHNLSGTNNNYVHNKNNSNHDHSNNDNNYGSSFNRNSSKNVVSISPLAATTTTTTTTMTMTMGQGAGAETETTPTRTRSLRHTAKRARMSGSTPTTIDLCSPPTSNSSKSSTTKSTTTKCRSEATPTTIWGAGNACPRMAAAKSRTAKAPETETFKAPTSASASPTPTATTTTTTTTTTITSKEKFLLTLDLLAVVRRNASDKLKLIQMVHDNPILWDSRLPNFKGAEEEKTRAWEFIGKEFNAPGRRVARAFKSLRESYRRELAHVKVMGSEFKPKWSLYEAMDFLRDVIRERKGGSHMVDHSAAAAAGLNLSALSHHNLSHNNNNNNNNNNNHHTLNKCGLKLNSLSSSFNDSALNLSSRSSLNLSQDDYYYFVKPEMDLSYSGEGLGKAAGGGGGGGGGGQPQTPSLAHHHQQQQQQPHHHVQPSNGGHQQPQQHHDTRVSSTRNDTSSSQNHAFDDMDASSLRSGDEASVRNAGLSQHGSDEVEELEAIDADFPYPLILDNSNSPLGGASNGHAPGGGKRRRKADDGDGGDDGEEDDDDAYGGQMMQQHRHLRQQSALEMPPPQTVREVLNSKFCGFISAKLNSMEDTEADNLMNKILMLLVQTQGNALQSQDTK